MTGASPVTTILELVRFRSVGVDSIVVTGLAPVMLNNSQKIWHSQEKVLTIR